MRLSPLARRLAQNRALAPSPEVRQTSPREPLEHRTSSGIAAEPKRIIEVERKDQCSKVSGERRLAQLGSGTGVRYQRKLIFSVEHRLPGRDERVELGALGELVALLVDLKVEKRDQIRDLVEVVLLTYTQPPFVRLGGDVSVERELVG